VADHDKATRVPRDYRVLAQGAGALGAGHVHRHRALHIGTAGNISATLKGGSVTAMPVPQGLLLGEFTSVLAAGTTVTGVWAAV
jgi:hypothetical protein